jgi:cytochrome c oxidase cbb3-type subunit 3
MNNPLPRWWVWLFIITVVFALIYLALYPGAGVYQGQFGWSSEGQLKQEMAKGEEQVAPVYAKFAGMRPENLQKDAAAMDIGKRLFLNNCAQCHGSDARGAKGFPNLTDGDWLWGGEHAQIVETITKGRNGVMPPMAGAVGGPEDVRNVAHYVLSLSGSPHDALRASVGKAKYAACAACHGADGKGNIALGAPNLTDKVWLHGFGEAAIVERITKGVNNQMPAQSGHLSAAQIEVVAAYVQSLSK